ncbi:uncharacterized protein LOC121986323 [Zingiber officinale]|uniref:Uncharacterized protein n=1 Tax=Zingiber officinale TaxID=94328 RepID=A0A8J5GKV2_ZINOF|nr:uncharacterized protein LOC121986323 [Zingiber officinale]KAG6505679.1 hypothetical protein ZIOFF_038044 [Zingiber officinale]
MITRSNLAEQLREYQVRSSHEWAIVSFFTSSRVDVILVLWELLMFAFIVFSGVALYFQYIKVALVLVFLTFLMLVGMKVTRQVRRNNKMKRKMLLPLSM